MLHSVKGYSTREVADLLQVPESRVRSFARAGFLQPGRGARSEYRFSFQDIVLLRAARALEDAEVPPKRIWSALRSLQEQLPADRSLASVRITAVGEDVVVRDAKSAWEPYSGQAILEFDVSELIPDATPMVNQALRIAKESSDADADDWFHIAIDLETIGEPERAVNSYQRVLQIDPSHVDAKINLGRLYHDEGNLPAAEKLYRAVIESEPDNILGYFNLGVVLDDQGRAAAAIEAYERALVIDKSFADAHFNLARLHERDGHAAHALRHFARYRALTREG